MVFFSCNSCNEALKKNQVEKHNFKCRGATYSCIDCMMVYTAESYKGHIKCITEDEKYGAKGFVAKENKGEQKQNAWVDQVNRAIEFVQDPQVKTLLLSVASFGNIPRKEAKFVNFLKNSCRLRDATMAAKAWAAIAAEAEKMREEALKKQAELQQKQKEEKELKEKNGKADAKTGTSEAANGTAEKNGDSVEADGEDTQTTIDFKWKKAIKRKLKDNSGEMKVKKLRKEVLGEYSEAGGDAEDDGKKIFDEKLAKSGIRVEGKTAYLS